MMLFPEPALVKFTALPAVKRLSMKLLLVPVDAMPAVELPPSELETIMPFVAPALMPVPLLLQVLLATTLSLPPLISMPVVLLWQMLFATSAQAQESQMPMLLSWQ